MATPTSAALNAGTLENMVAMARQAAERVAAITARTRMQIADLDPDLRESAARERAGALRAQARVEIETELTKARQIRETVTALRSANHRLGAMRRSRFASDDRGDAIQRLAWIEMLKLTPTSELPQVVSENRHRPAIGYIAHVIAAQRDDAASYRASLDGALGEVETEVEALSGMLDEVVRTVGRAEIAALELNNNGRDPAQVLSLARTHGVADPVRVTHHPAEAAAAGGGDAA